MSDGKPIKPTGIKAWIRDLLEAVLPALVIVLVINVFLAQATRVEGQSMEPNLRSSQRLVIEKMSYRLRPPRRGDIVVVRRPQRPADPLIKRVVALPGETIEIKEGRVYIEGTPLDERYLDQATWGAMPPKLVPEGHVFVMGDNRGSSNDSRVFGVVPFDDLVGRAWLRYWPPQSIGLVE